MPGRRPLTPPEQRRLLRVARRLPPRDRALLTALLFSGHRVSEILSLRLASVWRAGAVVGRLNVSPRYLKGGYGPTRSVPILPEFRRALEVYIVWLRQRYELDPALPLIISREVDSEGAARALSAESARRILLNACAQAGIENDGRLGTHSLRKAFAMNVYRNSGNDLMVVKAALQHSSVVISQAYLSADDAAVELAIRGCDFTRKAPRPTAPRALENVVPFSSARAAVEEAPRISNTNKRQSAEA